MAARIGWARLTLSGTPGSTTASAIYEAPTGNRLRFTASASASGFWGSAPGVYAELRSSTTGYTLTMRDQAWERFDLQGRLLERRTVSGRSLELLPASPPGRMGAGEIATATDTATGRTLTFQYGMFGGALRLASVTDHTGRIISYDYTEYGDLKAVTDLRGGTTRYGYDGPSHRLTTVTDATNTLVLTNEYDSLGRVNKQTEASGLITTYVYSALSGARTTTITRTAPGVPPDVTIDHYRADNTLHYQEHQGALTSYTTFGGDVAPTTLVDARGSVTRLEGAGAGLPAQVTDPTGRITKVGYDDAYRPASRLPCPPPRA